MPRSPKMSLPFRSSEQNFVCISRLSHACYMPCLHELITLIISGEAYKLWSSSLCSLLPLRSKHSLQHPVLKHPQSMFFPFAPVNTEDPSVPYTLHCVQAAWVRNLVSHTKGRIQTEGVCEQGAEDNICT
jgi:hypothetical protein